MELVDDPRPEIRQTKFTKGRNSESFDPKTMFVRPQMRIIHELNTVKYPHPIKSDDVIITPNFEADLNTYNSLLKEMKEMQDNGIQGSEYISWQEGVHLIVKNPEKSPTFQKIVKHMCEYYDVDPKTISVRYNLFKDDIDFKSLHHDSAAFNKERAEKQNITIGLSLGKTRELAFKHAKNDTLIYMPMPNGSLYSFSKAVNIQWLHGINAIPKEEQTNEGRISIIVWGLTNKLKDEPNEPKILENNDRRSNLRKLNSEMVHKELQNFSAGSDKIPGSILIKRIIQCIDKKKLIDYALSISRFTETELNQLNKIISNKIY